MAQGPNNHTNGSNAQMSTPVNTSHRAAQYLQKLEDGRTFTRYAERAFLEAAQISPDEEAFREAIELRSAASGLRRRTQEFKQRGLSRFNPKRRIRRVIISDAS